MTGGKIKINWFTKLLLKFWPRLAMRRFAKGAEADHRIFELAHKAFSKSNRVDLIPLGPDHRGFMIILDEKIALYFYQDGDGFIYDGYEMGEYNKGDVTIFDDIKR